MQTKNDFSKPGVSILLMSICLGKKSKNRKKKSSWTFWYFCADNNEGFRARYYNASLELRRDEVKYWFFKIQKITFQTYLNKKSFIFSEDHNDIFGHKYHIDPGNLFSIYYSMLKYQNLT